MAAKNRPLRVSGSHPCPASNSSLSLPCHSGTGASPGPAAVVVSLAVPTATPGSQPSLCDPLSCSSSDSRSTTCPQISTQVYSLDSSLDRLSPILVSVPGTCLPSVSEHSHHFLSNRSFNVSDRISRLRHSAPQGVFTSAVIPSSSISASTEEARMLDRALIPSTTSRPRLTPSSTRLFPLVPADPGRSLRDRTFKFVDPDRVEDVVEFLRGETTASREVQCVARSWYVRRIHPPCAGDFRIERVFRVHR